MGVPEDGGSINDKIGLSPDHELAEVDDHLTWDGVGPAVGSVAGASKDCVWANTVLSTFGGMRKWMVSSLVATSQ